VKDLKILILISNEIKIPNYFYENFIFLSSAFGDIHIVNVKNILKKKLNKFNNKIKFKNFIYNEINNKNDLYNFLCSKNFILLNILDRSLKYHSINRLIKKTKTPNIIISDTGYVPENILFLKKKFFKSSLNLINYKINYYLYRLFTILRIYPQIELFLESSKTTINMINNGISKKIDKFLNFPLLSYYKNLSHINSKHVLKISKKSKNKIISFLETPINHPDRVKREGKAPKNLENNYYKNLNNFLNFIQKIYKMKIIICAHPFSNITYLKKKLKNFKIEKYKTEKYISKSELVIFHQSSAVIQAICEKKKIINLLSRDMGEFLSYRNEIYNKYLNLVKFDITKKYKLNKDELDKKLKSKINNYSNYIKSNIISNKNISHNDQIIIEIKKYFNNFKK
jgi:hypothetical protein